MTMGSRPSALVSDSTAKKSLYRRYEAAKSGRDKTISSEDMQKHVGMTPDELSNWSQGRPGVAGNQNAGSITVGPATGLGGLGTGSGYGGWGPDARGDLTYPPQKQQKPSK
ncbi:hypothetical protein VMCG_06576 [Cytospora schulzeri]|uniref:Uncharacterized protein n=1 Tax=Cytospora schulzeri TaxID=448051 RepID=A0A423W702_9PEZI|nr:hypothetical protein VMCG_06576 [Valsa malicola]